MIAITARGSIRVKRATSGHLSNSSCDVTKRNKMRRCIISEISKLRIAGRSVPDNIWMLARVSRSYTVGDEFRGGTADDIQRRSTQFCAADATAPGCQQRIACHDVLRDRRRWKRSPKSGPLIRASASRQRIWSSRILQRRYTDFHPANASRSRPLNHARFTSQLPRSSTWPTRETVTPPGQSLKAIAVFVDRSSQNGLPRRVAAAIIIKPT